MVNTIAMDIHSPWFRISVAAVVAVTLAAHGYRKKSLSPDGCLAAFIVGLTSMGCSYRFGMLLLLFYYSSTKLTKFKQELKDRMEEDFKSAGERNWQQVFASSILAIAVALIYVKLIGEDANVSFLDYSSSSLVSLWGVDLPRHFLGSQLQCMYVAHFATANGDTWASEVGMLSKSKPRLITSFCLREVPPGTNGGMSLLGTVASGAGGAFIGLVYYLFSFLYPSISSASNVPDRQWVMIIFGFLCGIGGSLIDSFLGATLQASYYSDEKKMIVKNYNPASKNRDIRCISGFNVLSNEAVNFLSIGLTMMLSWFLAPRVFSVFR